MASNYTMNKLKCMVCLVSANATLATFYGAKCGHVACKPCWDKLLDTKLECPYCKKKVRPNNLIKVVKTKMKVIKKKFL